MTALSRATLPATGFELGTVFRTDVERVVELARLVPLDDRPIPYFWVEAADLDAFEAELRADERVERLSRCGSRAGTALYRVGWAVAFDDFLPLVRTHGASIERGVGANDEWAFRIRGPDRSALRALYADCRARDLPLSVESTSASAASRRSVDEWAAERIPVGSADTTGDETSGGVPGAGESAGSSAGCRSFRGIVGTLGEVVWMTDPDEGELLHVDPAYEGVWGEPRERRHDEPHPVLDAIHPDDRERVRTAFESRPTGAYDEVYRIEPSDGTRRWIHDRAVPIRNADGEVSRIVGIAEDVTDRVERERELARTSRLLDALSASFPDLVFVIDEDGYYREYLGGTETESLLYADPEELLGSRLHDVLPADVADRIRSTVRRSLDADGLRTVEYRLDVPAGPRWFEARVTPIRQPGDVRSAVVVSRDITRQKRREDVLMAVTEATRALLEATTPEDVADLAARTVGDVLEAPLVGVYLLDDAAGSLRPVARLADGESPVGDLPSVVGTGSRIWKTFVDGDTRVSSDTRARTRTSDPPVESELIVPLGDYGVFVVRSPEPGAFDDVAVEFAELLAANTTAVLGRAESQRNLQRQNERLTELSRLNDTIRSINRAIVNATTRDAIVSEVPDRLVENDAYPAAWIGEYRTDDTITVHAAADATDAAVGDESISVADGGLLDKLLETATRTRAVHVIGNLGDVSATDPWHEALLERGTRGAAVVPLTAGEAQYGVLTLYTDRGDVFDEEKVATLRELGQTIGRAIRAAEIRRALTAGTAVELEFEIADADWFLGTASEALDCRLTLDGVVPTGDGELLYYVETEGASPEALTERAGDAPQVDASRVIGGTGDGGLVECRLSGPSPIRTLVDYGATVRSATAEAGVGRLSLEITPEADVRTVRNGLRDVCPGAELVRKRELDRSVGPVREVRETLTEALTDKQSHTLRTAYFAGYFEWPRGSTAEEIADSMGIASSTFHFHLRHAMRKLFVVLFEREHGP
ncbi:bacterio-opsin activator domain-containing protein [Haloplanus halophilus]|uniref:bacterio-opsin activator domain-containing protein n=1 Tax=Haloplanus halophilus TaxID=2949993 RepID=UPI00203EED38|nr:bacterio-opsin activator domain-containing protein [Haloplanus sp. GDY1]